MQGALIVSADPAIRKSLASILQPDRTVHEAINLTECLKQAAAEKFDFIFLDGIFEDGSSEELAARLHALGYGPEIIPVLLSVANIYQQPFRQYGARFFIAKPFNLRQVNQATERVEEILQLSERVIHYARESTADELPETAADGRLSPPPQSADDIDVREVSQRFRRLLARLQSRDELVRAFADSIEEQFDVDNVVILLPSSRQPQFQIAYGEVQSNVKSQFHLAFNDPLLQILIRLGEPVWVHDCERLGRANAMSAIRCGERLNVQILCPVLSRGRLKAVVGLSRFHRYSNNPAGLSLLRLFLTFFAEALENSDLYTQVAATGQIHQAMFQALDLGLIAVSAAGLITETNPAAAQMLNCTAEDLQNGQPIEKAGSRLAHHARTALEEGVKTEPENIPGDNEDESQMLSVSALPLNAESSLAGALIVLRPQKNLISPAPAPSSEPSNNQSAETAEEQLWSNMTQAVAHNFKNAFVPMQTCAELLPERYQDEKFQQFFKETMGNNIQQINHWIEQLLGFSNAGQLSGQSSLSLREVMEQGIERARKIHSRTKAELKVDYGLNDIVKGDREKLEQAFFELACNALEAVRNLAEPVISVQTNSTEHGAEAVIEDNGAGLEETVRESARHPFVSTKLNGNLGLGLSCAERIIKAHGGDLRLETAESGGTRTRVILPQSKAQGNSSTKQRNINSRTGNIPSEA